MKYPEVRNYVAGNFVNGEHEYLDVYNPGDGSVAARFNPFGPGWHLEHSSDLLAEGRQTSAIIWLEVTIVLSCLQPVLRLHLLRVGIAELGNEMLLVSPLCPRFRNLRSDGAARPAELIRQ